MDFSGTFKANTKGKAKVNFSVDDLIRWSPQNPKLYKVKISISCTEISEKIGFRSITTKGKDILLNGKSVFLKGISLHEEVPQRASRAYSKEDARMLLNRVKELNCNYVRLAHYPHNRYMTRMADKMGIMVWSEIPVYWTIDWENKNTYQNAENQLIENITRDKNRASIIIWSMGNETPISKPRNEFLINLSKKARELDQIRLMSAALEIHPDTDKPMTHIVEDPFAKHLDIIGFNEYIGWYDGLPEKCLKVDWEIPYDKPVVITEFGGGALQGFHGDSLTRWSEEYQENLKNA